MPNLNGVQTLKQIRLLRPAQKVVIFTSSSDPDYLLEKQAEKEGIVECLLKPVAVEDILRIPSQQTNLGSLSQTHLNNNRRKEIGNRRRNH